MSFSDKLFTKTLARETSRQLLIVGVLYAWSKKWSLSLVSLTVATFVFLISVVTEGSSLQLLAVFPVSLIQCGMFCWVGLGVLEALVAQNPLSFRQQIHCIVGAVPKIFLSMLVLLLTFLISAAQLPLLLPLFVVALLWMWSPFFCVVEAKVGFGQNRKTIGEERRRFFRDPDDYDSSSGEDFFSRRNAESVPWFKDISAMDIGLGRSFRFAMQNTGTTTLLFGCFLLALLLPESLLGYSFQLANSDLGGFLQLWVGLFLQMYLAATFFVLFLGLIPKAVAGQVFGWAVEDFSLGQIRQKLSVNYDPASGFGKLYALRLIFVTLSVVCIFGLMERSRMLNSFPDKAAFEVTQTQVKEGELVVRGTLVDMQYQFAWLEPQLFLLSSVKAPEENKASSQPAGSMGQVEANGEASASDNSNLKKVKISPKPQLHFVRATRVRFFDVLGDTLTLDKVPKETTELELELIFDLKELHLPSEPTMQLFLSYGEKSIGEDFKESVLSVIRLKGTQEDSGGETDA